MRTLSSSEPFAGHGPLQGQPATTTGLSMGQVTGSSGAVACKSLAQVELVSQPGACLVLALQQAQRRPDQTPMWYLPLRDRFDAQTATRKVKSINYIYIKGMVYMLSRAKNA